MSLMPLGLLSQGGGASVGPVAFELISTQVLSGASSSVTFSSIPSTYKHLQLRVVTVLDTYAQTTLWLRLNGDSGSNYSMHKLYGSGGVSTDGAPNQNQLAFGDLSGSNSSVFGARIIDILDYSNGSKYSTVRMFGGLNDSLVSFVAIYSGNWRNSAVVDSITLQSSSYSLGTNSRFSLYGVKGS